MGKGVHPTFSLSSYRILHFSKKYYYSFFYYVVKLYVAKSVSESNNKTYKFIFSY